MRKAFAVAACGMVLAGASVSNAALIASWSFNAGDSTGLTSDVGGYTLTARGVGSNATLAYNGDGTVSLGGGQQLYAAGINSTALPTLLTNATVYLRVRFDAAPGGSAAFAGLMAGSPTATAPGTYPYSSGTGAVLAGINPSSTTAAMYAAGNNAGALAAIAPGSGFPTIPSSGSGYTNIAIVFDNLTDLNGAASANKSRAFLYADGNVVSRDATAQTLMNFDYLALGRLVGSFSSGAMTLDSVQVYDEALTPAQIGAIPEPTTLAGIALAGGVMLRRRARKA